MQNMPLSRKRERAVAISEDGGKSFAPVYLMTDFNRPCARLISRHSWPEENQSRILFSSPVGEKRLVLRPLNDEGKPADRKMIHEGPGAYSNMVRLPDGNVGLLVEIGESSPYETISFITFDMNWLED